ncbi:unnamed protein product [Auanema sp. JU1783]|nr:unnamed protein product [Auanema sp. JU1783]
MSKRYHLLFVPNCCTRRWMMELSKGIPFVNNLDTKFNQKWSFIKRLGLSIKHSLTAPLTTHHRHKLP